MMNTEQHNPAASAWSDIGRDEALRDALTEALRSSVAGHGSYGPNYDGHKLAAAVSAALVAAPVQAQEPVIWYDANEGATDVGLLIGSTRSLNIVGSSEGPFGHFTTPLYAHRAPVLDAAIAANKPAGSAP